MDIPEMLMLSDWVSRSQVGIVTHSPQVVLSVVLSQTRVNLSCIRINGWINVEGHTLVGTLSVWSRDTSDIH